MIEKQFMNGRLLITQGDITEKQTDAIVNAANSSLMGGGGVDGAIHRKGGPAILEECKCIRKEKYWDGLPPGDAVATGSGNLPSHYVIHTVGPVWRSGNSGESDVLAGCYRRCLEEASKLKLRSIAFPAISTGVYGYPKSDAARVAYSAIKEFLSHSDVPELVYLVFFSYDDLNIFINTIHKVVKKI